MHLGRNITYECLQSQSVSDQVLNTDSDVVFKKNVQQRNNISFKKDTEIEKVVLLQVKNVIQIIIKFRDQKICAHFSCT